MALRHAASENDWTKSSYSTRNTTQQPMCVEVQRREGTVGIRDSKNPGQGGLSVSEEAFGALIRVIKARS